MSPRNMRARSRRMTRLLMAGAVVWAINASIAVDASDWLVAVICAGLAASNVIEFVRAPSRHR